MSSSYSVTDEQKQNMVSNVATDAGQAVQELTHSWKKKQRNGWKNIWMQIFI